MSTFTPQTVQTAQPDPFKHVNYTQGMTLSVEEFTQDFAYLLNRQQWTTRDLLGYGTVCGLRLFPRRAGSEGWEIVVEAGEAVNPRGEWIRVPAAQCARLRAWVDGHIDEIRRYAGSPPGEVRVYVVLCCRDCLVDPVYLPGEPCRSEDDSFAPGRVQDDYSLELVFEPPNQRYEDGIRDFGLWLSQVEIEDLPDSDENRAAFLAALRGAVPQFQSPPGVPPTSPPDYLTGSPPLDLRIPRAAVYDYLRAAFRVWATELRPLWLGANQSCDGLPPDDRCVLLGEALIPLTDEGLLSDVDEVLIDEERRPYLLPLRLVQEWLMRRVEQIEQALASPPDGSPPAAPPLTLAGDVTGDPASTLVAGIHGLAVALPDPAADAGKLLAFDGAAWVLVDPPAPGGGVLPLAGDVTGDPASNTVARLQNRDLTRPTNAMAGQFLSYTGTRWRLAPVQQPIAAGRFAADGATLFNSGKLAVRRINFTNATLYFLTFADIAARGQYVVKATVVNSLRGKPQTVEVITLGDDPLVGRVKELVEEFNSTGPEFPINLETDILLRVSPGAADGTMQGLMIEINQV